MEQLLRKTFCRYDMVCDAPSGIGLELVYMPAFFADKPPVETSNAHVHGFYEIVWFREGEGIHYVDFKEYPVRPNTIFFISPGQVHSFDQRHDQKGIVLKVCSQLLSDASGADDAYLKYNVFNAFDSVPYSIISERDAEKLEIIIRAIEDEMQEADVLGHKEYVQALVKMLIIRVERSGKEKDGNVLNPSRTSHKAFLTFRQKLEAHYHDLHTVKDYAALMNISTKTLTTYVAECSTYTPLEIINNRIILEAKRLLRYSNLMVKEIAFRLGFDDPSYFVKFFKRHVHCLPADYRDPE